MTTDPAPYLRHIQACRNADPARSRLPFRLGATQVGWLDPALRDEVLALGAREDSDGICLAQPADLPIIAGVLAARGRFADRRELFDVRATPDGPALTQIDRGALPAFGIEGRGVHMNGLVQRADGLHLWVARRGADRPLDPGKLDHLVAGGIPAGLDARATLIKEAGEEAGIAPDLAAEAVLVGDISYVMDRPEGLRRDRVFCFDLTLPDSFVPRAVDGEAAGFELWPIERVRDQVRDTDDFKFNVNLVLIDLFLRLGVIKGEAIEKALLF
jgi:8-oxo-dGTP pyrophosphatase MutT (NUDIX family)